MCRSDSRIRRLFAEQDFLSCRKYRIPLPERQRFNKCPPLEPSFAAGRLKPFQTACGKCRIDTHIRPAPDGFKGNDKVYSHKKQRPSEINVSDGLIGSVKQKPYPVQMQHRQMIPIQKNNIQTAACRPGSRIRHLFAEQGTHIAWAVGQTSDSRVRPMQMMLPNCFYFVRLFLWIGIKRRFTHIERPSERFQTASNWQAGRLNVQ